MITAPLDPATVQKNKDRFLRLRRAITFTATRSPREVAAAAYLTLAATEDMVEEADPVAQLYDHAPEPEAAHTPALLVEVVIGVLVGGVHKLGQLPRDKRISVLRYTLAVLGCLTSEETPWRGEHEAIGEAVWSDVEDARLLALPLFRRPLTADAAPETPAPVAQRQPRVAA